MACRGRAEPVPGSIRLGSARGRHLARCSLCGRSPKNSRQAGGQAPSSPLPPWQRCGTDSSISWSGQRSPYHSRIRCDDPSTRLQPEANPMIFRWFAPTSRESSIASLYGAIVAQARKPAFYQTYGVPDTVTGRLEMIMLHAILVLRRLQEEPAGGRDLGQGLFDHFCRDMDDNMREM